MRSRVVVLAVGAMVGLAATANHRYHRAHPHPRDLVWQPTLTGYTSATKARNNQILCICGGYECFDGDDRIHTDIAPTHLGYKGPKRIGFLLIKDPEAGDHPDWGRHITSDRTCLSKQKNAPIHYTLTTYTGLDSAGVNEIEKLKLSIK